MTDVQFMRRALLLAERGRGRTSPNPMVGATLVDGEGVVVGDGYHRRAGTPHAEVHALDAAGPRARGSTLYCTLEPCCHLGRTGPCTARIIAAGIQRVVAALADPNPLVAGGGFRQLREHGIQVDVGVLEDEARALNAEFRTYIRERRPFVLLKAAVSLDGCIAAGAGQRTAITGPAAWRLVHRWRAEVDAIGVGSGTVLADDPVLTAREVYRERPLARVIFDRGLRTPPRARVFSTLEAGPVLVVTSAPDLEWQPEAARRLADAGAELIATPDGSVASALRALGEREIASLLLEGGTGLHVAAWDAGMIDRVALLVAPDALGGGGLPWLDARPFASFLLERPRIEPCGRDVLMAGDVHRAG